MEKEQIPQDIQEKAHQWEQSYTYANGVERAIARDSYIQGRIDERTAHIPVPILTQEEVEKMAETYANYVIQPSTSNEWNHENLKILLANSWKSGKEGWVGSNNNAANPVCSTVEVDGRIDVGFVEFTAGWSFDRISKKWSWAGGEEDLSTQELYNYYQHYSQK